MPAIMVRVDLAEFLSLQPGDPWLHPCTSDLVIVTRHATAEMEDDDGIKSSGFFLQLESPDATDQ